MTIMTLRLETKKLNNNNKLENQGDLSCVFKKENILPSAWKSFVNDINYPVDFLDYKRSLY